MTISWGSTCGLFLAAGVLFAASPPGVPAGFPHGDESLHYTVNWPSGLSLGDASLHARRSGEGWEFEFSLDAAVPGFAVRDRYRSVASAGFCSLEFDKSTAHGQRASREKTTFDYRKGIARRVTVNGGKTEIPAGACARDALNFVFFARRELAEGRLPARQVVLLGSPYQVQLEYAGVQNVSVNDVRRETDHVLVSSKGPASGFNFEVFFSRDAARTPVVVRVPFGAGVFSMELVP
jgi:hypothetical protein